MADNNMKLAFAVLVEELFDLETAVIHDGNDPCIGAIAALADAKRSVPKVHGFVEDTVKSYSDIDFRRDFRLNLATYRRLIQELSPTLEYPDRDDGKEGSSVETQVLVYLWYMANQDSMRELGKLFGLSTSTVFRCVRRVSEALCNIRDRLIKWPDTDMQDEISESVEDRSNIPDVIGFIDGTHIRLTVTPNNDNSYINRKGFPSIVLQIIVDDRLLITDCYVGWPGSTHDARVYRNSPIYNALQTGQADLGNNKYIIGDGAYPLSRFLITPFRDTGRLTPAQRYFNNRISSRRQTVERAIGHLKGRFRRLRDVYCHDIADVCKLIVSACVLHNLCILCDDSVADCFEAEVVPNYHYQPVLAVNRDGVQKRNDLVRLLEQLM